MGASALMRRGSGSTVAVRMSSAGGGAAEEGDSQGGAESGEPRAGGHLETTIRPELPEAKAVSPLSLSRNQR